MPPILATFIFVVLIVVLILLDRNRNERPSAALWIPTVWLGINASRPVSEWLSTLGLYSGARVLGSPEMYSEGSPLDRLVFSCLILAAFAVLAVRRDRLIILLSRNRILLSLVVYCCLSTLWAEDPFVAFKRWIKYLGDVGMICILLTDSDRRAAVRLALIRTAFVLIPLSVLLIRYYPDLGRTYHVWTWTYMYTGVTVGKNMLGVTCMVLGLASLWCFLWAIGRRPRALARRQLVAHGILLAMTMWLLKIANSMTSLSCFALLGSLLVALRFVRLLRRPPFVHALAGGIIALPLLALFLGFGDSALESMGRDSTLTGRTAIWDMVIQMTDRPVIGAGFESFWFGQRLATMWSIQGRLFEGIQSSHNGYLEVFVNLGWIGLLLTVVLLVRGYARSARALSVDLPFYGLQFAYIGVAIIYNLTEAGFRMMSPVSFAFALAVMGGSVVRKSGAEGAQTAVGHPGRLARLASAAEGASR